MWGTSNDCAETRLVQSDQQRVFKGRLFGPCNPAAKPQREEAWAKTKDLGTTERKGHTGEARTKGQSWWAEQLGTLNPNVQ